MLAQGTSIDKITFKKVIIEGRGKSAIQPHNITIDNANIIGGSFDPATGFAKYGSISLTNSLLKNTSRQTYLWYPTSNCLFERNRFINIAGFGVITSGAVNVVFRNNLFLSNKPRMPAIKNYGSYAPSSTIVELNSFLDTTGTAVKLPPGYNTAMVTAISNYWGTIDTVIIDSMIFDKNDDLTSAGFINYVPFLLVPDTNTPLPPPIAPTNAKAVARTTSVMRFTWKDNSLNETGFNIYRKVNNGPVKLFKTLTANTTRLVVRNGLPNQKYTWFVQALNGNGTSTFARSIVRTLANPTTLRAKKVTKRTRSTIKLTWRDRSVGEKRFVLQRRQGANPFRNYRYLRANSKRFTDIRVKRGITYRYRLKAISIGSSSSWSNVAIGRL